MTRGGGGGGDGEAVAAVAVVDPQAVVAVKKKSSRSWVLLDATGQATVLDVDKYAIMHRVHIHARDLRIVDPLLSYPSAILGRDRAIVLNLEHIKAIITAEEVLLRDPLDENVIPVVEELQRRLPPVNSNRENQTDGREFPAGHNDVDAGEQDELETAAYPALDALTSKISSRNLDRVCKLKSAMTRLTARVQKVQGKLLLLVCRVIANQAALDKAKYMDGLRAVRKHIQKLEQDLELLKAHAKRKVEFSYDAIEETPEDRECRVWELLRPQCGHENSKARHLSKFLDVVC